MSHLENCYARRRRPATHGALMETGAAHVPGAVKWMVRACSTMFSSAVAQYALQENENIPTKCSAIEKKKRRNLFQRKTVSFHNLISETDARGAQACSMSVRTTDLFTCSMFRTCHPHPSILSSVPPVPLPT